MNTEDEVDVALIVLHRCEYEDFRFEDGKPLTDLFPEKIYCSIIPSPFQVLEIASELTGRMRAMGFTDSPSNPEVNA